MSLPDTIVQQRKCPESRAQQAAHHQTRTKKPPSYFFNGHLFESRERTGEEADDEGGWRADDVQHGGRQHGDVCVLPGERVEQSHDGMTTLRQSAVKIRQTKRMS